jgi:nucleotide-binding universal stress UspA family protein
MLTRFRPGVVAGICGDAGAMAVVDLAATEAARRGVGLRLCCWAEPDSGTAPDPASIGDTVLRRFPDLDVVIDMCAGDAVSALIEASRTAALLAIDARSCGGRDPVLDVWLPDEVMTHAHCPVLVIGRRADDARAGGPRPVLLGLDGSEHSAAAVPHALEAANVRRVPLRTIAVRYSPRPVADAGHAGDQGYAEARQLLDQTLAAWRDTYPHVPVTAEIVYAPDVATALVDASADADLVVVGARGRSTVTCLVLGSVSRALVERARCPVLIIHAYERAP